MKKCGTIITPSSGINAAGNEYLDPIYIRQLVIFCDTIDCPDDSRVNVVFRRNRDDLTLLEKEGIFVRTRGNFFVRKGGNNILSIHDEHPQEFWTIAQLYSFMKHCQYDTDISWSISQTSSRLQLPTKEKIDYLFFVESGPLPDNQSGNILPISSEELLAGESLIKGKSLETELYQALFVPSAKVPIEDILRFKDKRKDELLRYRGAMHALYLNLMQSEDIPREKNRVIEEMSLSINAINTIMTESFSNRLIRNVKTNLQMNEVLERRIHIGHTIGGLVGLPELGAILGGMSSYIRFDIISGIKPRIPHNLMDYAYLYNAKKDFE